MVDGEGCPAASGLTEEMKGMASGGVLTWAMGKAADEKVWGANKKGNKMGF